MSDRRNIIVIVDEAHRSHYDDLDGYARHLKDALPKATLIAFTGTPISFDDRNTQAVFGDYIDVYDLSRAVADGATVPVHFEPRLIKMRFAEGVDEEDVNKAADELTKDLDDVERDQLERSVAVVNAMYGSPQRLAELASDLVAHWETRRSAMAKFIGSPARHSSSAAPARSAPTSTTRSSRCVPTGTPTSSTREGSRSSTAATRLTPADLQPRPPTTRTRRSRPAQGPDDELEIVIVKDMMLTRLRRARHIYLDRPLKGALLMQTLARVNRTFRGKQDGLLVAYAPLADNLQKAPRRVLARRPGQQADGPQPRRRRRPHQGSSAYSTTSSWATTGALTTRRSARGDKTAYGFVVKRAVNHLRDPRTRQHAQRRRGRDCGRGIPTSVEPAVPRLGAVRDAPRHPRPAPGRAVL